MVNVAASWTLGRSQLTPSPGQEPRDLVDAESEVRSNINKSTCRYYGDSKRLMEHD